jgi:hypothetical protein
MITVTVVKRCGATTVRARVTAPSIGRALELAGEGAKVELPIEPESFFAPAGSPLSAEEVRTSAPTAAAAAP